MSRRGIVSVSAALALLLTGCGPKKAAAPVPSPGETAAQTGASGSSRPTKEASTPTLEPTEEGEELWGFPIDDTHDAFEVDTKGELGTVLVTVETGEDTWDGLYQCTFSVWDGEDLTRPIQTFEKAGMICWSERLDANFDGYMDFTYTYYHGANNATYGLYLWDEAEKRFVESGEFWGYGLSPDEKTRTVFNYIHSSAASGVQEIYRWEDGELVCVRTVEVDVSLDWDSQELVVRDWAGDEGIEVYRKSFAMSEDSPIYDEAVKWHDLDYHGEEG